MIPRTLTWLLLATATAVAAAQEPANQNPPLSNPFFAFDIAIPSRRRTHSCRHLLRALAKKLKTILIFVGIIWAVFLVSFLLPLTDYGLQPRSARGLLGIITMPFLHGSLGHIVANTIPLIVLLFLLTGSRARSWVIVIEIIVLGGVILWICRPLCQSRRSQRVDFRLDRVSGAGRVVRTTPDLPCGGHRHFRALRRLAAVGIHSPRRRRCRGTVTCAARSPVVCSHFSWPVPPSPARIW